MPWWTEDDLKRWRKHGPMHGERTHRWQRCVEGNSRKLPQEPTIVSIYTVMPQQHPPPAGDEPLLYVELMRDSVITQAHFTPESAQGLAEATAEFVREWGSD